MFILNEDLEDDPELKNTSSEDDEEEEDENIRHRASTIVKVMRLEKAVNSINSKLEDIDPQVIEENRVSLQNDIKALNLEIKSLKEQLNNMESSSNTKQDDSIIARLDALEARDGENNDEVEPSSVVDFSALSMRIEKVETAVKMIDQKKSPTGGTLFASFASRLSFVSFLLAVAGFAIKAYTFIMSKNSTNSNAYEASKNMSEACNDVMMYVACIAGFTAVLSLIGLFIGKGKRVVAFLGIILSAIAIVAYVLFNNIGILAIE
jgi:hypothetical protein